MKILLITLMILEFIRAADQTIATSSEAYNAADGCTLCLRKSQYWIMLTANLRKGIANNAATTGKCCTSTTDSTNCASTQSNSALDSTYSALQYITTNSLHVLIGQCEFEQAICTITGTNNLDATSQIITIDFTMVDNTYKASLTGSFTAQKSSCTWIA